MLFIQSVTYDLANPDDGSCGTMKSMKSCLQEKSTISTGNKCLWDEETSSCSFRSIDHDFEWVLIVAVFSGLLSAPFSIIFQSLILFVLAAKASSPHSLLPTKRNMFLGRTSQLLFPTSLQGYFRNILNNIQQYRKNLSSNKLKEFDRKWEINFLMFNLS